jgi:PAS domain S-box-containing protein
VFHQFVETLEPYALFTTDPGGLVTHWNRGAELALGFPAGEIVGRPWAGVFTPEDVRIGVPERELRAAAANGRADWQRWLVRRDGSRLWALATVCPVRGADGTLTGFGVILRDWTEQREREEMILARGVALWEADEKRTAFLGTTAHELRNQLAPLITHGHLLQLRTVDPDVAAIGKKIYEHVRQMAGMIDELLDATRVSRGKIRLVRSKVDAREAVRQAVETAAPAVEAGRHGLTVSLPPAPLWVDADPQRLNQVLVNLLTNAAKYTPDGGRIEVAAERDGGDVVFRVKDNGIGIPPDQIDSIFELYAQVVRSLPHSRGGLGIGLALVRELVSLHGGTVRAASAGEGLGSEFLVRLPSFDQ